NPSWSQNAKRYVTRRKWSLVAFAAAMILMTGLFGWGISRDLVQMERIADQIAVAREAGDQQQNAKAAAELGEARVRFDQLWAVRFVQPGRLDALADELDACEAKVRAFEASQFTALFGQASLLTLHRDGRTDGKDLIEDSLKAYRVMSTEDWQTQSPFADLDESQQRQVAENISELVLVSILDSCEDRNPTKEQWDAVLRHLPQEHRQLRVFARLRGSAGSLPNPEEEAHLNGDFDSYLFGVWASHLERHELASVWYAKSAASRQIGQPERFWLRYRQGLSCQLLQRLDQAAIYYAMCIGIRPDFAWAHFNMGLVCHRTGQYAEAVECLERAIRLDPMFEAAYSALGAIHLAHGQVDEAISIFDEALARGLSSEDLLAKRAKALEVAEPVQK
ncbi:MAG: tetratricopeptide repeat protein, partial [Planctomycetota bacterium]